MCTGVLSSLVSSQTVDEVLVKAGSGGSILPGIAPDSSTLTQVI